MKQIKLPEKFTRSVGRFGLKLKKHSPEILIVSGIIGTVTSTVLACKATTKVGDILDESKKQIEQVHIGLEHPERIKKGETYTIEDSKKDLTIIYTQTAVKLIKLYAPAFILGVLSISGIVASNEILRKRNIGLAAAYAAVDQSFKDYRKRVIDRFGENVDHELRYNVVTTEAEEVITNEDGTETTVTKTVSTSTPHFKSEYRRCYDESCAGWTKTPELNLAFLVGVQRFATEKLRARGHLFLNELYDELGMSRTMIGQQVGWVYDENSPDVHNYVDLGLYDADDERKRAFINGYERNVWIDPNVDGVIWDLIN